MATQKAPADEYRAVGSGYPLGPPSVTFRALHRDIDHRRHGPGDIDDDAP
jgi:hypothetical protein